MIKRQIHPSVIISGYKTACKLAVNYLRENLAVKIEDLGDEGLTNVAKTCMSSKLIGGQDVLFARVCVEAIRFVRTSSGKHPVKNVHVIKAHGKSSLDTTFFPGYVTRMSRVS